jgi:TupA-like ATPgrasp
MHKIQLFIPTGIIFDFILSLIHTTRRLKYIPNFIFPRTLNEYFFREKIIFTSNLDLAQTITDKSKLKTWLDKIGLTDLTPNTYLVTSNIDYLKGYLLPSKCIIKPTHSSGKLLIINEGTSRYLSQEELLKIDSWLKEDYYRRGREPNYRNIEPRIMIEELLVCKSNDLTPDDYKIFCIKGIPYLIQLDTKRFTDHSRQLYSPDWELLPYSYQYRRDPTPKPIPPNLSIALNIARKISRHFHICRVDMYLLDSNKIKVGEVTFFPENCGGKFKNYGEDLEAGNLIRNIVATKQKLS